MFRRLVCPVIVALWALASVPAPAAPPDLTAWFVRATGYQTTVTSRTLASPDFLPGNSLKSMACGAMGVPILNGIWVLAKYDRRHHIALAAASTDQCSVAVFVASPPSVHVPDADLSGYRTGRGVHIGSSYANVLVAYGTPGVRPNARGIVAYSALVPATTETQPVRRVQLPETITVVITGGRVSSILMSVDLGGLY